MRWYIHQGQAVLPVCVCVKETQCMCILPVALAWTHSVTADMEGQLGGIGYSSCTCLWSLAGNDLVPNPDLMLTNV